MKTAKALVLLSGGLDSMLSAKVLQAQGIEVVGLCFISNFYGCARAQIAAKNINIELKVVDIKKEMLALVKNPPSGYGKHLNPCVDCHALMIRCAGEIARTDGFDFVATGEVLGQRPFSQNKKSLEQVQKLAGIPVLRPLSAKLLPESEIEKKGLVNRGRLLDIYGRSREPQFALAKKYNIKEYPSPAGGCLLTDPEFSERLIKLLEYWPDCAPDDIELLKHGRVFWLNIKDDIKALVVVGRHQIDNERLGKIAQNHDIMIELEKVMGPTTLMRIKNYELRIKNENLNLEVPEKLSDLDLVKGRSDEEILNLAGRLTGYYSTKARGKKIYLKINLINN